MKNGIFLCLCAVCLLVLLVNTAEAGIVNFYEASDPAGYPHWYSSGNMDAYNAWLADVGETPDFREDFDGIDWKGDPWYLKEIFDIQYNPTAIFTDGVTFRNDVTDPNDYAKTHNNPGSTPAIDQYAWRCVDTGDAEIIFSSLGTDYLGFFIFDVDHGMTVTYTITLSNGENLVFNGLGTDEDRYRFVGFVNHTPGATIVKFEADAPGGSRFGIDEIEWGRTTQIPEPASMSLLGIGLLSMLGIIKRRAK